MVSDLGVTATVADVLNDLATSVAEKQRDASIPSGTVLAESDLDGALHREVKQNSMVRLGKQELPERFEAWDIYGRMSLLPTAQMARMLSKPNAERPEMRAFHVHTRGIARTNCTICPPSVEPYEGTCSWCLQRAQVRKTFQAESDYEAHCEYYHPREWTTLQRQLEREQRTAELAIQKELAEAMMAMARGQAPTVAAIAATPVERVSKPAEMVDCPNCGATVKAHGLPLHQRRWCKGVPDGTS